MATPLLEFQALTLAAQWPYDHGVRDCSLSLGAGELALLLVPQDEANSPLADLAMGLLKPDAGTVLFAGQSWASLPVADAERRRYRLRRIFQGSAWLSNLDLWENLLLASTYHTAVPEADLLAQAEALARELGLPGLPAGRPAMQAPMMLRLCQWLRVLLGPSELWLLEDPVDGLPPAATQAVLRQVAKRRQAGTGVLWLSNDANDLNLSDLAPTAVWRLQGEHWVPVSLPGS